MKAVSLQEGLHLVYAQTNGTFFYKLKDASSCFNAGGNYINPLLVGTWIEISSPTFAS